MLVKQVDRSPSFLAWCPIPGKGNLIAAATREGTLDENFQSHNSIHLFNTKFDNDCNLNIPSVGVVETQQSFTAIAWGQSVAAGYDCGLIAGGMNDGSLTFWDPNQLTSGSAKMKDAIIHTEKVHSDPITSLDFNQSMPKYLASGSLDGKVYIWDLSNPLAPNHQLPPSGESSLNDRKRITAVAWNCTVPYILSSSNAAGETSIWDLRNKRLAITFRSRSMQSATAVAWNPQNARQLVVSYDSNVAEIWDLRQFISPKAFLEGGHQRSILDVSWCPQDSNMLLTTGDDNQAILWNEQGHLMHRIPFENDSNFIAEWSPQKPGVLATCSFRGQIGVHSVQWCGSEHVPQWIKKPAGVNFGFGGRVVAFKEALKGASPKLDMYKLDSDPTVGKNAEELASLLQNNNQETLQKFANSKIEGAETEEEKTIWEMINLFYENDYKNALFDYFGFPKDKEQEPGAAKKKKVSIKKKAVVVKEPEDDLDDGAFFDRLGSCNDLKAAGVKKDKDLLAKTSVVDDPVVEQPDLPSSPTLANIGVCDPKVREALVTKNFALAVELSLSRNRIADALVFAKHGGAELWDETCSKFLSAHDDSFIRNLFQPVSERNFTKMVEKSDVNEWKQTLCMILSYASSQQEANQFITELGKKLTTVGHLIPAMSCFIVATDLPRLFGIWGDLMSESHGDHHPMIEKIFSISNAPNVQMKQGDREAVAKCYGEYANYLVAEGHVQVAAKFLMVTKESIEAVGGNSQDVNQLLHRINEAHPELGIFPKQKKKAPGHHGGRKKNISRAVPGGASKAPYGQPQPGRHHTRSEPVRNVPTKRKGPQPTRKAPQPVNTRKPPARGTPHPNQPRRPPTRGQQDRTPPSNDRRPVRQAVRGPGSARNGATPTRNPPRGRNPPPRNTPEPATSRTPPSRGSTSTRRPPTASDRNKASTSRRMPPSRGQTNTSSERVPSRGDPVKYPPQKASRKPATRGASQPQPSYGQPVQRGSRRQHIAAPADVRNREKRTSGGFFGQESSALAYTDQMEADSRNVLQNLSKIITEIEQSGKINGMQNRKLRNSRSKITQIQGLLSNRQLTPQSYEKLADIVDALLNKNCNAAMTIQNQIQTDKLLRNTSRTWVPALKDLTNLARIVYN